MPKLLRRIPWLLICLIAFNACNKEKPDDKTPPPPASNLSTPVDAVKTFFQSVYDKKYDVAWASLSTVSQDKIIQMVAEEEKLDPEKVRKLFNNNDMQLQMGFWNAFRDSSKVELFAPTAKYKVISESGNEANVEMSALSTSLENKAIKEGNGWRMGYIETYMPNLLH